MTLTYDDLLAAAASDARFHLAHPFETLDGAAAYRERALGALRAAFPDLERRETIRIRGVSGLDAEWIGFCGYWCGGFHAPFLDIPPTRRMAHLRFHEFFRLEGDRVVEFQGLWDLPELMMQAGVWPMGPSLGREWHVPAPATQDGLGPHERDGSSASRVVNDMLVGLGRHADGGPDAMGLERFWHPSMSWYGPAGIGTGRGLAGFVDAHQRPFRLAFPNRQGGAQLTDREAGGSDGGGHYVRLGDGPYSVTGGWPSVRAEHRGGALFGTGPTDRAVEMRVMDFYGHHEGLIRENWVPIDVPHLLLQMGVDVFERLETQFGEKRLGLAGD